MANPYNLRLRRPGQHRYTDPDSDTEKETDTTAKEDASSDDPESNDRTSVKDSGEVDLSDARGSSSHVPAPTPPPHQPVTASRRDRDPTLSPTHLYNRSIDSSTLHLYLERFNLPRSEPQLPIMNNNNANDPNINPSHAPRRVASEPTLHDADSPTMQRSEMGPSSARVTQPSEMGLTSESEHGELSHPATSDDKGLQSTPFLQPTNASSRLNVEDNKHENLSSEKKAFVEDASDEDSDKENYVNPAMCAQAQSPVHDQSHLTSQPRPQAEQAPRPNAATTEPVPAAHEQSSQNILPEFGYGYGYGAPSVEERKVAYEDLPDAPDLGDDEPHFFRDALAEIEARRASEARYEETSLLREILETVAAMPGWHEVLNNQSNEDQNTDQDDSWMEEYFDFDKYYRE
ncbi:hypothetical protein F1880_001650 [Penicillium rolfsii]|nr:hypothetical protein F1880_001650 [Penicillium rolfsii]